MVDRTHISRTKEFLSAAGIGWAKAGTRAQQGRTIAHIRDPDRYDEIATGSLATEIEFLETPRKTPPLFVSCYTEDTPYEALAGELCRSLDRHGLPHRIDPVRSRGNWVANVNLKAETIMRAWNESSCPICWIDADAELLRLPYAVFDNPFDIAMVRRQGWSDLSFFVYFGKSDATGKLIEVWTSLCRDNPDVWDQVLLTLAWYRTARSTALTSLWLHDGIFRFPRPRIRDWRDRIFYYPYKRKVRPSVAQKQASRHLKAFVNVAKEETVEFGSHDINSGFREMLHQYDFTFDACRNTILTPRDSGAQ